MAICKGVEEGLLGPNTIWMDGLVGTVVSINYTDVFCFSYKDFFPRDNVQNKIKD